MLLGVEFGGVLSLGVVLLGVVLLGVEFEGVLSLGVESLGVEFEGVLWLGVELLGVEVSGAVLDEDGATVSSGAEEVGATVVDVVTVDGSVGMEVVDTEVVVVDTDVVVVDTTVLSGTDVVGSIEVEGMVVSVTAGRTVDRSAAFTAYTGMARPRAATPTSARVMGGFMIRSLRWACPDGRPMASIVTAGSARPPLDVGPTTGRSAEGEVLRPWSTCRAGVGPSRWQPSIRVIA